jgi:hypothetical protein
MCHLPVAISIAGFASEAPTPFASVGALLAAPVISSAIPAYLNRRM